jgi:propanediol dehydratase small subunit
MMSSDYPLSEKHPDLSGALELQARIAESCGREHLAENLRRAAELVKIPDPEILRIYSALRPGRADKAGLYSLAADLENRYGAGRCAALVREAADAYGARSGDSEA